MAVCYAVNSTILRESDKGNCVFSPDSSYTLFSLLYDAYDGETQESIKSSFNWKILEAHEIGKLHNLYDGQLINTSKLFYRPEGQLQKETRDKVKNKCDIEVIDVKSATSSNAIMNWSKQNTNDPTFNLFQSSSLNNVINFDFQWANKFQKNGTTKEKFYKSNTEIIETEFMNQKSNFGYKEDEELNAHILEIPYSNDNVSMFVFVPKNEKDISQLENKLTTYYELEKLSHIQKHSINISIPKFKFNKMFDMKNILQKTHQNNPPYNLSTLSPSHMGKMLTKASIEVDENGAKATAASAFELILDPRVKETSFETTIANRFAKTLVTHKMENLENFSQEATFSMILPEDAFISEFVMVIKEKSYKSYVREKEEAKHIYDEAVTSGRGAAHVAVSARDSNKFTVSVNIEPLSEATFLLTYEELLQRKFDQYELVLNIHPGYLVDIIKVLVKIRECRKLRYVNTPAIRSGNELKKSSDANTLTEIEISDASATVKFEPDIEYQKQIASKFEKPKHSGFCGQFVIQYDVELDPSNGEIFVNDGYFVHFYAPDDLPPLAKHVVFTLDTSGSMDGRKIEQVQEAMQCILDQIRKHDVVDILEFTDNVTVHDLESKTSTVIDYEMEENYYEPFYKYERISLPGAKPANNNIINNAKNVVKRMMATNSTHIIGGLETALYLVKICQEKFSTHQPIIVFLTDGQPNEGIEDTDEITRVVTKLNQENNKVPIFSLSFGEEADKYFLRKLSLSNFGFSRHIYEASDASLQLQQFYKQISSPLLSNVTFTYDSNVEDATRNYFPIYFQGSDIVLCGRYTDSIGPNCVNLIHPRGHVLLSPIINQSSTPIERLWAYLTIKQMLEHREHTDNIAELTKKAVELALKYSFVTEVTSLVVVKPDGDESSTVNTESAFEAGSNDFATPSMHLMSAYLLCGSITRTCCSGGRQWHFSSFSHSAKRSSNVSRRPMRSMARCSSEEHSWEAQEISLRKKIKNKIVKLMKIEKKISVPSEFMINRPFLVIIQAKLDNRNVILFMGRILEPVCEKCSN